MTGPTSNQDDEREIAVLLSQLKVEPSAEARARAFAQLQQEFRAQPASAPAAETAPARRRALPRWAIAAGVAALAITGALWTTTRPLIEVAKIEALDGTLEARGPRWFDGTERLAPRGTVSAGQSVAVAGRGGALLRVSPDLSLRLASGTRLRVVSSEEIALAEGEVFVDATPGARAPLRIVTPQGVVTHLGTQYLVRARGDAVEVSVREGRAQLQAGGNTSVAEAGYWLLRRDGKITSGPLADGEARFTWIATLPSEFRLQGATLAQFLAWFKRESGLTPIYSTGVDIGHFDGVQLSGSIDNLTPLEALSSVLATADLSWHREGAKVVIEKRSDGPR